MGKLIKLPEKKAITHIDIQVDEKTILARIREIDYSGYPFMSLHIKARTAEAGSTALRLYFMGREEAERHGIRISREIFNPHGFPEFMTEEERQEKVREVKSKKWESL